MNPTLKTRIISVLVVAFVIAGLLRTFIIEGFIVRGESMDPTIHSGEYVIINRLAYLRSEPRRGDIVVAEPREFKGRVLKRIIGLPSERFEIVDGQVTIRLGRGDEKVPLDEAYTSRQITDSKGIKYIKLDPSEYFALGDNRGVSIDSRELGPIDKWDVKGRVFAVLSLKSFKIRKI